MKRHKTISLALLIMFMSTNAFSQELLGHTSLWLCHTDNSTEVVVIEKSVKTTEFEGDTYQAVFTPNQTDAYYIRMDGSRLIRYDKTHGAFTLCDFSLKKGDGFTTVNGREMQVVECGETRLHPQRAETYHFQRLVNTEDSDDYDIWIDGYGSLRHSIFIPDDFPDFKTSDVMFDWNGIVHLFSNEVAASQLMNVTKSEDPWLDEETMELCYKTDSLHCEYNDGVLSVSGRLKLICSTLKYMLCEKQEGKASCSVFELPPLANCEASHYFQSEFSLRLDDEEMLVYRGDNNFGESVLEVPIISEGITSGTTFIQDSIQKQSQRHNTPLYDLSGRRLNTIPERGFHIQNGKKFIK